MAAPDNEKMLTELFAVIESRKGGDASRSYTAKLFAGGIDKIAKKLGEEAVETVIAAVKGSDAELVGESADLLYHLLVLLAAKGIKPEDVFAELRRREGISGIDEKAARKK